MGTDQIWGFDRFIVGATNTVREGLHNIMKGGRGSPGWTCPCRCMRTSTLEDYVFFGVMTMPFAVMLGELLSQYVTKPQMSPSCSSIQDENDSDAAEGASEESQSQAPSNKPSETEEEGAPDDQASEPAAPGDQASEPAAPESEPPEEEAEEADAPEADAAE